MQISFDVPQWLIFACGLLFGTSVAALGAYWLLWKQTVAEVSRSKAKASRWVAWVDLSCLCIPDSGQVASLEGISDVAHDVLCRLAVWLILFGAFALASRSTSAAAGLPGLCVR